MQILPTPTVINHCMSYDKWVCVIETNISDFACQNQINHSSDYLWKQWFSLSLLINRHMAHSNILDRAPVHRRTYTNIPHSYGNSVYPKINKVKIIYWFTTLKNLLTWKYAWDSIKCSQYWKWSSMVSLFCTIYWSKQFRYLIISPGLHKWPKTCR